MPSSAPETVRYASTVPDSRSIALRWPAIAVLLSLCSSLSCGAAPAESSTSAHACLADGVRYPSQGCGYEVGSVVPNFSFQGRVAGIDSPVTTVHFADFYDPDGTKGLRYLLVNATTLWCPYCKGEMLALPGMSADYRARGVRFMTLLLERADGSVASQDDVDALIRTYALDSTVVNDPKELATLFFAKSSMPLNLIIDLRTMKIVNKIIGAGASTVRTSIDVALGGS